MGNTQMMGNTHMMNNSMMANQNMMNSSMMANASVVKIPDMQQNTSALNRDMISICPGSSTVQFNPFNNV